MNSDDLENERAKRDLIDKGDYPEIIVNLIGVYNAVKKDRPGDTVELKQLEVLIKKAISYLMFRAVAPIVAISGFEKEQADNISERYTDMLYEEIELLKKIKNLKGDN
jgi:hypothetical protein